MESGTLNLNCRQFYQSGMSYVVKRVYEDLQEVYDTECTREAFRTGLWFAAAQQQYHGTWNRDN